MVLLAAGTYLQKDGWRTGVEKQAYQHDRQPAEETKKRESFGLCITPEGTRSLNPEWKKGFYFIALKAGIPILLYGVDYEKKVIQCTKMIIPSGDVEKDMREIKLYFKDFKGKKPEKFSIGNID